MNFYQLQDAITNFNEKIIYTEVEIYNPDGDCVHRELLAIDQFRKDEDGNLILIPYRQDCEILSDNVRSTTLV